MKKRNVAKVKEMKLEITALKSSNKNLHSKLDQTKEALVRSEEAYEQVQENVNVFQSKYEHILKQSDANRSNNVAVKSKIRNLESSLQEKDAQLKKLRDEYQALEANSKNRVDAVIKETRKHTKEKYEPKLIHYKE